MADPLDKTKHDARFIKEAGKNLRVHVKMIGAGSNLTNAAHVASMLTLTLPQHCAGIFAAGICLEMPARGAFPLLLGTCYMICMPVSVRTTGVRYA